jgi:hypothetical protein
MTTTTNQERDEAMRETGWLCEWNHRTGPEWWSLQATEGEGGYFTKDSLKALRFARKQDAEAYIEEAGWTEIVATEHEWSDPTVASAEEPNHRVMAADLTQLLLRCTRHLPEDDKYRVQALDYIRRKNLASPLRAPTNQEHGEG